MLDIAQGFAENMTASSIAVFGDTHHPNKTATTNHYRTIIAGISKICR
jgi:hypothetical protein